MTIRVPRRGLGPGEGRAAPGYTRRAPGRLPGDARAGAARLVGGRRSPRAPTTGCGRTPCCATRSRRCWARGRSCWPAATGCAATPERGERRRSMAEADFEAPLERAAEADRRARRVARAIRDEGAGGPAAARGARRSGGARCTRSSRPGRRRSSRGTRTGPTPSTTCRPSSRSGRSCTATAATRDDPALVCGFALYHERAGVRRRAPEGARHEAEDLPQLRHAQAGGLPQGAAGDAARREVRPARSSRFVDTPGRLPGPRRRGARARPRRSPSTCARWPSLRTPIVVTVTGEGGSGGALAIAVGDRVNMLEHAVYSVISPEGCASILFRDAVARRGGGDRDEDHGARPRGGWASWTRSIPEPPGGAHVEPRGALQGRRRGALAAARGAAARCPASSCPRPRYRKFRDMGRLGREFREVAP